MEMQITEDRRSYAVKITAEENGKPLGWAFLFVKFGDRHSEPYGYLENVFVEPEHQKQGIGTKLVHAVVAEAKKHNCYKIIGTSKHHKTHVHEWYKKHGFQKYGYAFRLDLIPDSEVLTSDGKENWTPLS